MRVVEEIRDLAADINMLHELQALAGKECKPFFGGDQKRSGLFMLDREAGRGDEVGQNHHAARVEMGADIGKERCFVFYVTGYLSAYHQITALGEGVSHAVAAKDLNAVGELMGRHFLLSDLGLCAGNCVATESKLWVICRQGHQISAIATAKIHDSATGGKINRTKKQSAQLCLPLPRHLLMFCLPHLVLHRHKPGKIGDNFREDAKGQKRLIAIDMGLFVVGQLRNGIVVIEDNSPLLLRWLDQQL